ncbi:M23 family metallopeptidase [Dawidia soli]|uniref:M23 family metallopeptidase n=1 Tax=Dawidia soli TaxID=2782352 RepID=A0AAP2GGC5_9BACT|nr:M23 family metallopeptidase [Dawidia soli]MBT1690457.1 M23 family metallopeptidase [Dawidia soli]
MTINRLLAFLFVLGALSCPGQTPVTLHVLRIPSPVVIEGETVLYCELVLTNVTSTPQVLKRLTILDTANSSIIRVFDAEELRSRYATLPPAPAAEGLTLVPQTSGLIYIELTLSGKVPAEPVYAHILEMTDVSGTKMTTVRGGAFEPLYQAPVVLGAPLRDGRWVAVYEPSWERGHRRVVYPFGGTSYIPGRFAIDFILLGAHAKMAAGDKNIVANWYGYGADVLAVSDGVVADMGDDFEESATIADHPVYPAEKAAGNYIVLAIDNDRYVFYEHLKPRSIAVQIGQKVKKGDRIAALGFTGQTTGPHLHLHVADRSASVGTEGLPFVFENFTLLGSYPGGKGLGERRWVRAKKGSASITQERPGPNAVISFR